MKTWRKALALLLAALLLLSSSALAAERAQEALDYGDEANWAYYAMGEDRGVDVFLICPTVDTRSERNAFDLNEKLKGRFLNALDMEKGIYEESGRLFSPYYRQMSINAYTLTEEERTEALSVAYRDVSDAFRWYLDNENAGRGLILAGFSQGSQMCLELMKEYFSGDGPEAAALREKLIAVYAVGWSVTEELTAAYPRIVPAAGETDTGVVVSFDCEDGTLTDTIIIPEGTKALSINPLNWRTDGAAADKTLNRGAVMGIGAEPVEALCGAYIGTRGELVVTDVTAADYPPGLDIFPEGAYHLYDYMFFFTNLKENVAARTAAWRRSRSGAEETGNESAWAAALRWAKESGVMTAEEAEAFDPEGPVTRAKALTLLWKASGSPAPASREVSFADLTEDWYLDAVAWAAQQGVTLGRSSTAFYPDDHITRSQMAAFLYRAQGEPGKTGEGPWWRDADRWAFDHAMIFGHSLPGSGPDIDDCPGGEMLIYLYRCFTAPDAESNDEVVVLFTSDVHCGFDQGFGYIGLYQLRTALEAQGYTTILVDDGDSIQGEVIGTLSRGETIVELMNALGYDAAIPGNHEFSYGMDRFLELAEEADFPYISCNFNLEGEPVFPPYIILEAGGMKLAFVGVTTPETFTSAAPSIFQDEEGRFIYGFCQDETGEGVYEAVQRAVDAARAEGAEYVYVLGHMGNQKNCEPWTYADVIGHVSGIDVFLDGHSHDTEQVVMKDRDGRRVVRSACGTKLACIGYSRISPEKGVVETGIWSWPNTLSAPDSLGLVNEMSEKAASSVKTMEALIGKVVAHASVTLTIYDPEAVDGSGNPIRMVRRAETNLGDLCADAFRAASGADAAIMNGGGIRKDLKAGDVTYGDIVNVFPYGNQLCVIAATGQQILDALEWGASGLPGESGGFLHVSGMSYEIDVSVPSGCFTDEFGLCAGIEGPRRVRGVMIGGEPLDPARTYTLAGTDYTLLDNGDGFTAFNDAELLLDRVKLDSQLLIDYILEDLGGEIGEEYADPYGQGRISFIG